MNWILIASLGFSVPSLIISIRTIIRARKLAKLCEICERKLQSNMIEPGTCPVCGGKNARHTEHCTLMAHKPGYVEPRSTDYMHHTLREHVGRCDECRRSEDAREPRKFGAKDSHCAEYRRIVRMFADGKALDSSM